MPFSLSGNVITQANESGIAITAAASITGGVRFTCTQSYAVGNLIRITGTTNYNGEWIVAAATGTTFDVLQSVTGGSITFVSSQTGTAARGNSSLAGLVGLSGVTTRTYSQGGSFAPNRVVYILSDRRLRITGTLAISPRLEALEFGDFQVLPELTIESGSTLNVVEQYGTAPNFVYGNNEWLRVQWTRTALIPSWDNPGIALRNDGTFNWRGGKIAVPNFTNFGTLNLDYGIVEGIRFELGSIGYFYLKGGTSTISRFVIGTSMAFGVIVTSDLTISNVEVAASGRSIFSDGLSGGSLTNVVTIINPPSNATTGYLTASLRGARLTTINVPTGSGAGISMQNDSGNAATAANARIEFRKRISFSALTLARAAIQDVHFFTRDTNNGLRKNTTQDSYTADRTHLATTNASGVTPQQSVLTAVAYTNSTQPISPMPITIDRRGVGNNTDDIFRWVGWAYGYLLQDLNAQMKGNTDALVEVTFFVDTAVTLSQSAAAALTSIATLNDLYDAAKHWKCQANATRLEYPTLFTQPVTASGTALDLGSLNVVIDPSAAAAFAINTGTNTITAKATTLAVGSKFAELQTTGTIGFANGGAASARLSGILTYGTPGAITQSLGTATLRFSTAGTYDLRAANISGTVTLENTSGGAVTVQLQPGVTFVNSGPNITVDNAVSASFTVSGMVAGSRLLIRRTDTQAVLLNEAVAGTSRVYTYTHTADIPVEIVARKATGSPTYQEWRTTATLTASGGAVTANQQLDE
jgi:hypothetical protein